MTCYFWESRTGTCHFEVLAPGGGPCADCPAEGEPMTDGLTARLDEDTEGVA